MAHRQRVAPSIDDLMATLDALQQAEIAAAHRRDWERESEARRGRLVDKAGAEMDRHRWVLAPQMIWVLDQDRVWTGDGNSVPIDDMSVRYKRNVVHFLERQACYLGAVQALKIDAMLVEADPLMMSDSTREQFEQQVHQCETQPEAWLRQTKLMTRLKKDVRKRIGKPERPAW